MFQIVPDLQSDLVPNRLLRLISRTANVRRQNDVAHTLQRRILQRLFIEHIQRRARDLARFESRCQRAFVH